ncbi:cytochrome P450 2J5 [Caerostris extrusa]|uniref:Cytochrome P450 2J5 n=1 Tax=Caerostris extrusa TaxID=172846 RepID=A0AAV4MA68_CAEEX|nr:cytochrome P450 2J5 [Caerostris extrusa]
MMDIGEFIQQPAVLITLTITWTWFIWVMAHRTQMRKPPPGPVGLPFLGYYPFLASVSSKAYSDLSDFYGEVFSFYTVGGTMVVVVNGRPVIKEVFLKRANEFDRRPRGYNVISWLADGMGFAQENRITWEEQRSFFYGGCQKLWTRETGTRKTYS